uniref:Uncharacterized protein n=1 Tax=Arundo donax TaxID=35708 RepID=A0A0A9HJS7_ARUDO
MLEEVREALEPLRVAERAHLDLHARRCLVGVGVADKEALERVGEHHAAVLPLVAPRADELHIAAPHSWRRRRHRRHLDSLPIPRPPCRPPLGRDPPLASPSGGLDWGQGFR